MIDVDELIVNYDKTSVLYNVTLQIPKGKMVAIVGPNGAGKSTLLKACLGLVKPLSGKISIEGMSPVEARTKISYVPQRESVDWAFPITAFELVLMGRFGKLGLFKWPRRADRAAATEALRSVGMEAYAERQIGELSGGQQQRLFLARALLQDGDTYFLDEPFTGIDAKAEEILMQQLRNLRGKGKTVVSVVHDLPSAARHFDWVILLNTSVIASGPVDEVFTPENISRTFGSGSELFEEVVRLAKESASGQSDG